MRVSFWVRLCLSCAATRGHLIAGELISWPPVSAEVEEERVFSPGVAALVMGGGVRGACR